ncbi:ImpA family metalloprotease [Vibrio sp. YMD68]|uniref:ImpA family metalloprotease n=1 Tax=Vibrio sp. YMD68 TaxID=3042300 RepID=UPI00249B1AAA|nr:ImpA family metalloprotease [Vibrio sp. YMD68]WGW01367.1 ImpA family metalloprotease [Vibrio sp. YMD68]
MKKISIIATISILFLSLSGCRDESSATKILDVDKSCKKGTIWNEITQQCDTELVRTYPDFTAQELVYEYGNVVNTIFSGCAIYTESLLPNGLQIGSGNRNWFSQLRSNNISNHVPALIGESGNVYAYKGDNNRSKYFVSGINLWSGNNSSDISHSILLQENVLNDLLEVEDYKNESLVVWSEDTSFNSHAVAANVTLVSSSEKAKGVEHVDFDLFIGKSTTIDTMNKVMSKGVPIIIAYNHHNWVDGSTANMFDVSYSSGELEPLVTGKEPCEGLTEVYKNTASMLDYLVNDKYIISSSTMPENTVIGDKVYFNKIVDPNSNKNLSELFEEPLKMIRDSIKHFDNQGINILEQENLKHLQIPVYIADIFRDSAEYKGGRFYADIYGSANAVDYNQWLKTYFMDLTSHFARPNNKLNVNLGEFSPREVEIQRLSTFNTDFEYELTSAAHTTATGYYVKAGQKTVISRTDSHPDDVKIYVNYQRDGATKLFGTGSGRAYNRPAYDRSHPVSLSAGGKISMSSPVGGTLFVTVPNNNEGNVISLNIQNILKNPSISGASDTDIELFENALSDTPFNWITVITKEVQIHSIASKFRDTLNSYNSDIKKFMDDIIKYTLGNFGYAGYLSNVLPDHSDSIKQFCSDFGIDELCTDLRLHERNNVQHVYVDRPTCGSLCSGNPYDRTSAYIPGDWGDSHEIGHNLQTNKLKIYGGRSNEVSNNIFPVESARLKAIENGESTYNIRSNFASTFELMKNGIGLLNVNDHPLWNKTGVYDNAFERLGFYNQLNFASGDLEFYTKMYLLQRISEDRAKNITDWANYKDRLGFTNYTIDDFKAMNGNDFMAISSSMLIGKDMSQFFEGFGIQVSEEAKAQILSAGYTQSLGKGIYFVDYEGVPTDYVTSNKDQYFIDLTPNARFEKPQP